MLHLNKEMFSDVCVLLVGGREEDCNQIAKDFGYTKFITLNEYVRQHPFLVPSLHQEEGEFSNVQIGAICVLREPYDW
jgi:hypothetical protein